MNNSQDTTATSHAARRFAYFADPDHGMPRTFEQRSEFYRSTGNPEHSAVQLGAKLAKNAVRAIIDREMADAIKSCAEEDLLLIVEAIRLNRDLHGEDSCQTGNLIGAILQTLGFGAGFVYHSDDDGSLEVHRAPQYREGCLEAFEEIPV